MSNLLWKTIHRESKLQIWIVIDAVEKEFSNKNILPKHLISGNDLKKLDIVDGLEIKKILKEVYDLQLNEILSSYDEAINWVKQQYCWESVITFGAEGGTWTRKTEVEGF